jgi:hypothetical protein
VQFNEHALSAKRQRPRNVIVITSAIATRLRTVVIECRFMPDGPSVAVSRSDSRQVESQHISDKQAIALAMLDEAHLGRFP